MSDKRVTLTVWRDARTDPPTPSSERVFWTDTEEGPMAYAQEYDGNPEWMVWDGDMLAPPLTEPRWYCDPQPPGEDALTVDDTRYALRRAAREAEDDALLMHVSDVNGDGEAFYVRRAAHLRSALEGLK